MTGMMKRILSSLIAVAMLLSVMSFVVLAEEEQKSVASVQFVVGEADENGIFTATLSIHNVAFISYQFGIGFDKNVVNLVDEKGTPSDSFIKVAESKDIIAEEKAYTLSHLERKVSNADGEMHVAAYFLDPTAEAKLVPVVEGGAELYEFRFKKIAEGDFGFALLDWDHANHGKYALLNNGKESLDFSFQFIYPESEAEKNTSDYYERVDEEPETDYSDGNEMTEAERLREERKAGTIVLQINNYAVSVNGVLKWVDKDNKNVVPYIENDRTMVPLRFISETMGAKVTWIPETRTIDIVLDETEISMQIDNTSYTINGETKTMDVAPVIREDRTFVPLRFVSEALNKSIYWNEATSVVVVAPIDKPWDDKDSTTQQLMTDTLWMFKWLRDEAYASEK